MPVELNVPTSFWRDVGRLADPGHADPPVGLAQVQSRSTAWTERPVQVVGHLAEGVGLVPEQVAGPVELGHASTSAGAVAMVASCGRVRDGV